MDYDMDKETFEKEFESMVRSAGMFLVNNGYTDGYHCHDALMKYAVVNLGYEPTVKKEKQPIEDENEYGVTEKTVVYIIINVVGKKMFYYGSSFVNGEPKAFPIWVKDVAGVE